MKLVTQARAVLLIALAMSLLAVACGGSASVVEDTADSAGQVDAAPTAAVEPEPTATSQPEPTPVPEPTPEPPAEPTATPAPAASFWADGLEPGACIIRLDGNPAFQAPNVVSCDEPHEEEIYAIGTIDVGPDEPFPGEDDLATQVAAELCDAATIEFAGEPWDQLAMETYLLYPLEEEWDAGDRTIACSAGSNKEGVFKIGTAAGGTLDTDDVLVVRSAIVSDGESWEDWLVVIEGSTLDSAGSLTDGQLDLQLRRPFPVDRGFLFNAQPIGADFSETVTWGYSWETQEFTDLGSVLPGQDISGTMIANDRIVFSARPNADADRDVWITENSEARLLVGGDGDQSLPSFTPDFEQVVYADRGDLWIINIDGSGARQLTDGPANDFESIVSPDGSTVVFASDRSGNDDLWSVSIDGGDPVNLTNHPGDEAWPVFSADGQYIYFGSDRLDPENNGMRIMVMEADGSNPSWFTVVQGSQAMLIDPRVANQVYTQSPTLAERFNHEFIEGEPGTFWEYQHASGRLTIALPAGWRVGDLNNGQIGFLASPRPVRYADFWEVDGVRAELVDGESQDEFFARYDAAIAVTNCEQFDGTDGIIALEENVLLLSGNFNCGSDGAVGGVLAFYNTDTGVGVLLEGQRDNLPDAESDSDMLTTIAQSVTWE